MKNKLKMLFAYFRGFKAEDISLTVLMEYSRIDDFGNFIYYDSKNDQSKVIRPLESINNIIEELVVHYENEYSKYNDYDEDEYWYLDITIKPFENKMIFKSSCKEEKFELFERETIIDDLNDENKKFVTELFEEKDLYKLEIDFIGRWGDGEVYYIEFDNFHTHVSNDEPYWDIVYELLNIYEGNYWNEDKGCGGQITIMGDDIFIKYKKYYQEYEQTKLNIIIEPDNFS